MRMLTAWAISGTASPTWTSSRSFAQCNVYARPDCQDCWAKLYCSGGCAANAFHATGSVRGVYKPGCELFKKRMECAIMVEASRLTEE